MFGPGMPEHEFGADPYAQEIKKSTAGFGEGRTVVIRTSQVAGTSPDFARALANKKPAGEKRFTVTAKKLYTLFSLDGQFLSEAQGKPNSLIKGLEGESRSAMRRIMAARDTMVWGDAGGTLGQLSASTTLASTTALMRSQKALFSQYMEGMRVAFSSDSGTGTSPAGLRGPSPDSPTTLLVTGQDWLGNSGAGSFTTDLLLNTVPSITVNDFVFFDGFYAATMTGKRGWCPITAPSAGENFFGVDRSTSPQLLSGWRSGAASNFEFTCIDALALIAQAGVNSPSLRLYANTADWAKIVKELGAKYMRSPTDSKQVAGAKGIEVYGPKGTVTIFGSNLVPVGNAWLGDPKSDLLLSSGEFPRVLDADGLGKMVRSASDDSYDCRIGGYANTLPNDENDELGPGGWVIVTWPT
jgi:hypothetical protein